MTCVASSISAAARAILPVAPMRVAAACLRAEVLWRCVRDAVESSEAKVTLCACDALQLFASCVALAMDAEQCAAVPLTACRRRSHDVNGRLDSSYGLACRYTLAFHAAVKHTAHSRPLDALAYSDTHPFDTRSWSDS